MSISRENVENLRGLPYEYSSAYDSSKTYEKDDLVVLNGILYVSLLNTNNEILNPANVPTTYWTEGAGAEKGGVLFDTTKDYLVGDVVSIADNSLDAPLNSEVRTYTCHNNHTAGAWSAVKGNWSDLSGGGTF